MSEGEMIRRKVRRSVREVDYVNTINVRDRVTIDFVWYPGALAAIASLIDLKMKKHPKTGSDRTISYKWEREGREPVTVVMDSGRITISLPPDSKGTLTAFGTAWEITRVKRDVQMKPVNQLQGVQERINRLGYHLRKPGEEKPGVDNVWGRLTERAILQFHVDYVPVVGAPPAAQQFLHVRGEWTQNMDATFQSNLDRYDGNPPCPNPTAADSASFQAALKAVVGA